MAEGSAALETGFEGQEPRQFGQGQLRAGLERGLLDIEKDVRKVDHIAASRIAGLGDVAEGHLESTGERLFFRAKLLGEALLLGPAR